MCIWYDRTCTLFVSYPSVGIRGVLYIRPNNDSKNNGKNNDNNNNNNDDTYITYYYDIS